MFSDGLNTNKLPAAKKSDSACRRLWYRREMYIAHSLNCDAELPLNVIPAQAGKSVPRVFGNIVD